MAGPNDTRNTILAAAAECFGQLSIKKTTVEDICACARISRPTFYRFFPNKQELITYIAGTETHRINDTIEKFAKKYPDIQDALVEAMCFAIAEARKSEIVAFMLNGDNFDYTVERVNKRGDTRGYYQGWRSLLDEAARQGRLREGIDPEDAAQWLGTLRQLMLVYARPMKTSRQEMRRLVSTYMIPALLS